MSLILCCKVVPQLYCVSASWKDTEVQVVGPKSQNFLLEIWRRVRIYVFQSDVHSPVLGLLRSDGLKW